MTVVVDVTAIFALAAHDTGGAAEQEAIVGDSNLLFLCAVLAILLQLWRQSAFLGC